MSGVRMDTVIAAILAESKRHGSASEDALQRSRRVTGFWGLVDLRRSASYRQRVGDALAYVRAETFARTVRQLAAISEISVFKELGDGLLLSSPDFLPLVEFACVLDGIARYWSTSSSEASSPFSYRFAATFGECTRLEREPGVDFLGEPLDLVARLSGHKADDDKVFMTVSSEVRQRAGVAVSRALPYVSFGPDVRLDGNLYKPGELPPRIVEMSIERDAFGASKEYFVAFRRAYEPQAH